MPQGEGGQQLPYAGTPEMDALFQQISQQPDMLRVVGQNPELLAEVMKHAGLDVDAQELIDMTSEWPDEAAEQSMQASLPPNEEAGGDYARGAASEGPPTADDEMEQMEDEAEQPPGSVPVEDPDEETQEASAPVPNGGSSSMPRGSNPIDDLISAQMMQSAVGNPNAPVPSGMQVGRQQRPAIPQSRQPSGGNAQQQMIADIFRKQGGAASKKKMPNARPTTR